jgi:hypothetical protein
VKAERRVLSPDEAWAEALIAKMLAACHGWQQQLIEDPSRRISALVGRGGGKTTALCVRAVKRCVRQRRAHVLYFATTRLRAKDLVWYPLKDLCDRLGLVSGVDVTFNETELRCTFLRTGSVYQLSGMSDLAEIEKWRGQSYDEVQIDEGASHKHELLDVLIYQVLGPRMRGPILIVGTAGKLLGGTFYDVTRLGSDRHAPYEDRKAGKIEARPWSSHWWTLEMVMALPGAAKKYPAMLELWENALQEFEDNKWGPEHPIRKREYGAVWASDNTLNIFQYRARLDDGAPWNEWDPKRVELGPDRVAIAELPTQPDGARIDDWLYALAMDHGSSDNFALNVFAVSPSDPDRTIYHVYCFEQPKMYARRIAILMLGPKVLTDLEIAHQTPGGIIGAIGWPTGMVSDVKALGQNILDELSNVYGIRVLPADQQGKHAAVELANGDLADGKVKILKDSHLAKQLEQLQWKKDEYGFPQFPKGVADHSADCFVYARRELANLFNAPTSDEKPKPKHQRDAFADPMGLDVADPSPSRGEFDLLFADTSGEIDFGT